MSHIGIASNVRTIERIRVSYASGVVTVELKLSARVDTKYFDFHFDSVD